MGFTPNIAQIGTNAALGIGDGYLARTDVTSPTRWNNPKMHRSLWLEGAAVIGGILLGSMSKAGETTKMMMAESAVLTGGALLARRVGVWGAEQREATPPVYPTTQPPMIPMVASAQVLRGVPMGGAGEFVQGTRRVALRQRQNRFF